MPGIVTDVHCCAWLLNFPVVRVLSPTQEAPPEQSCLLQGAFPAAQQGQVFSASRLAHIHTENWGDACLTRSPREQELGVLLPSLDS